MRHATVLVIEATLLVLAAAGVEESDVKALILGAGIEETAVQALLAASALGLQNGLTSSFRGMPVRTTHFTGTVTDLGLMLGRSRKHGIDKWKAAILTATLLLFLTGAVAGLAVGARFGGYGLLIPASICLTLAAISVARSRRLRTQTELPNNRANALLLCGACRAHASTTWIGSSTPPSRWPSRRDRRR